MSDAATMSASDLLAGAHDEGRPIIPFLGAGISVGSGFPSMTAITAYLAKVRFHIRHIVGGFDRPEAEYLRLRGWPDFSQLNADVWRYLVTQPDEGRRAVLQPFREKLAPPSALNGDELQEYNRMCGLPPDTPRDQHANALERFFVAQTKWNNDRNGRIRLAVQSQFWDAVGDTDISAARPLWPSILTTTDLRGDWYDLMMSLTEGDFDLIDALFLVLGHGRQPAGDHVYLAQLADAYRVRLYLSLNFDPLLETALWEEGHAPNVIEVAKDADLPSREAIRDRLTVLKLHGGAYGLRIGERIQESADPNTQTRAMSLIPEHALILVMGFSGYERRMTQILVEHARRRPGATQLLWMNFGSGYDKPLEKILAKFPTVRKPIEVRTYHGVSSLLQSVLVRARGAHSAGRLPYAALPTRPWAEPEPGSGGSGKPIIAFYDENDWAEPESSRGHSDASVKMARFCEGKAKTHQTIWIDCEQHHTVDGVVAEILDAIYQYDPEFQPLLMQSVGSRLKMESEPARSPVDPPVLRSTASPAPAGGESAGAPAIATPRSGRYVRPIERIREALQRGNYVLAIDSPETFGRPQTVHHGTPTLKLPGEDQGSSDFEKRVDKFKQRIDGFFSFLISLLTEDTRLGDLLPPAVDVGGSFVCAAFAPPAPRRESGWNSPTLKHVEGKIGELRIAVAGATFVHHEPVFKPTAVQTPLPNIDFAKLVNRLNSTSTPPESNEYGYTILTVLRRPRSHLAYYALCRGPGQMAPDLRLTECPSKTWSSLLSGSTPKESQSDSPRKYDCGATHLGGGLLWLPRLKHNEAYENLTQPGQTVAKAVRESRRLEKGHVPALRDAILSLLATAILHRRAARYYFSEVYEATGDMAAFREYIYHRVSYLRTLCRFLGVTAHAGEATKEDLDTRKLVAEAVSKFHYPDIKSQFEDPGSTAWVHIREEARHAWREDLGAFRATLSREFDAVLRKLYAGTWISITERLLDIDVREMFDSEFFQVKPKGEPDPNVRLCHNEIEFLEEELRAQQRTARFEMADWVGLLGAPRWLDAEKKLGHEKHQLVQIVLQDKADAGNQMPTVRDVISWEHNKSPATFVQHFIALLDLSNEYLLGSKIYHELARADDPTGEATQKQDGCLKRSVILSGRLAGWLLDVEQEGARDHDRRMDTAPLAAVVPEDQKGVRDDGKKEMPPFSREIKQLLHERLAEHRTDILAARARFGFGRCNPLEPAFDQGLLANARDDAIRLFEYTRKTVFHDGPTYNYFRAQSLRMVARCDFLRAGSGPQKFSKPISDLNLALRLLHRHGSPDVLELLACYRTKAEAYLLWARELTDEGNYLAARSRLESARSAIDRAGRAFDRRRRNVPWWLRLCHLRAQSAVVSCRLRTTGNGPVSVTGTAAGKGKGTAEKVTDRPVTPAFDTDLRYGLAAVRAGIDGLLPIRELQANGEDKNSLIWKATEWQWTRFASLWLDLAVETEKMMTSRFEDHWKSANRAARLPTLWEVWNQTPKPVDAFNLLTAFLAYSPTPTSTVGAAARRSGAS